MNDLDEMNSDNIKNDEKEDELVNNVKRLFGYVDENLLLQPFKSNENDIEVSLKIALDFTRDRVIPAHVSISKMLSNKANVLREKQKHLEKLLENLEAAKVNILDTSQILILKYNTIMNKQIELSWRAASLLRNVMNHGNKVLNEEEKRYAADLIKYQAQLKGLAKEIELVKTKNDLIKTHEDRWIVDNSKYYLHDRQILIIKDSLKDSNAEIEKLLQRIISIKELL